MALRFEKNIFDKYFSGALLKKRQIGKPFRYHLDKPFQTTRYLLKN